MQENNEININPEMPDGLTPEELLGEITNEVETQKEEISDKDLKNLVEFTTGQKGFTKEELDSLRGDDKELERLLRIAGIKAKHFNYNPKKNFGKEYKEARTRKNRQQKHSRAINKAYAKNI